MEYVKLLPQGKILQEWWQEVKENFWAEDAKPQVLKLVKELMESTILSFHSRSGKLLLICPLYS